MELPRLLIIDDLFGRTLSNQRNEERANLCGHFLIEDVTGDEFGKGTSQRIKHPIAKVTFCRGQRPQCAAVGNVVENDIEGTLQVIRSGWDDKPLGQNRWALVLLDLCFYTGAVTHESDSRIKGMPEGSPDDDVPGNYFGISLLKAIREQMPDLPVVILSSQPREQVSLEFSQLGAMAFLPRGDESGPELLREYIYRYGLLPDETGEIVGNSKPLLLTLRAARRAAAARRHVLIRGERGTGKELIARYVHKHTKGGEQRPFVVVDSGTLSPQLYASELFGHRRGAFTGAEREKLGRIAMAHGGELFLDEVGNLPPDVQTGLLRAIEYREVVPLGALESQPVDVRILSATNEELDGKAATGGFRQDLLDRLREGGTVFLRPLRERVEDIDLLVEKFVREAEGVVPGAMKRQIEAESLHLIRLYDWPGNIRELRSCVYNAVFNYPDVEHLVPLHLQLGKGNDRVHIAQVRTVVDGTTRTGPDELEDLIKHIAESNLDQTGPADLAGKLPALQGAYAHLLSQLLKAALRVTMKPTLDEPNGEVMIHPAVKLISGDKTMTASKSADIIKRVFALAPELEKKLLADPLLKEAYETSLRLRPRRPQSKTLVADKRD